MRRKSGPEKQNAWVTEQEAVKILKNGGVIAYPTETFYGLGADPRNPEAIKKIFFVKKREHGKPVALILSDSLQIKKWIKGVGKREQRIIKTFWPGPLTLVLKSRKNVSSFLTGGTGKLGIRVSSHVVACRLAKKLGGAITATSANRSGKPACRTGREVERQIGKKIDGIVFSDQLKKSKGSTIIDLSTDKIKVIREGDIPLGDLS